MRLSTVSILFLGVLLIMPTRPSQSKPVEAPQYAPVLWMDASANIDRMSSREKVAKILDKCVDAGIKTIIVDAVSLDDHL